MNTLQCVPPSPEVMSQLYMDYLRYGKPQGLSFKKYLMVIGYVNHSTGWIGMDDKASFKVGPAGIERISVPDIPVKGDLKIIVLLIDFPDKQGGISIDHYDDLLFVRDVYPTGSMADYYSEVSSGKVSITGSVHGWFRMPHEYSYYVNNQSGLGPYSYPRNAQRLAEDAVHTALESGIKFDMSLDKLNQGIVTALFLVHAGRGAEVLSPSIRKKDIWSHKWVLKNPVEVASSLYATQYLMVPYDCKVGVCAHELGHLAFQWQDFYDPNYDEDGHEWDGTGLWDLMAGGSYNGDSARPAHPVALHKIQHGWIDHETINSSTEVTLHPITSSNGKALKLTCKAFKKKQYLLLENRTKQGFDYHLPGEGLLVWRVDESQEQFAPEKPGLLLIQADGKHDLELPDDWNQGDASDPFPGIDGITNLLSIGSISTSFDTQHPSGINLRNITRDAETGDISLKIEYSE